MDRGEGADLMAAATDGLENLEDMIVRQAEATGAQVAAAKAAIGNVIFGQDPVVEQALITVLCGGHALLIGLPGLAKTKLVETMGIVLGLDARRIQFTPDLMPSDILGSEVLDESPNLGRSARPGPETGEIGKLISWGPSPRASQALMLVARARALIEGRLSPSIDDVVAMAEPILKHRMALTFAARADGESMEGVIGKLKARIG